MIAYPWPIGTCHFKNLPLDVQAQLLEHVHDGAISSEFPVHDTATEGPYIEFAGWKVRCTIETTSPTTYIVHLA